MRILGRDRPPRRAAGAALLAVFLAVTAAFAGDLSPQEKRGKQIYFEGTSPRGEPLEAYIGKDLTEVPGSVATCASCHGPDGRGRPEAGVIPSDVTWSYLFKPYGHAHRWGRKHPIFTEETLKESIVLGHDPAGNELDSSMPIYWMLDEDLDDLVAYMRRLENDFDPGLSETAVRIGTILPTQGRMGLVGQGVLEVIAAYFDDVNSRGGIHGRKIELIESPFDNVRDSPLAVATSLVGEGDVFALLSPVVAGADAEIGELVENDKVPVIGPLTLFSPDPYSLNDYTFYLFSGLREQVRSLVDFAAQELELDAPKIAVLGPEDDRYRDLRAVIAEQCRAHGWAAEVELVAGRFEASAAAKKLAAERIEALFFLGSGELDALLEEGDKIGWRPYVFLPGAFVSQELFELSGGFQGKVYLAYPTVPSDQTGAGIAELQALLQSHGFELRHRASQVSAFVAAKILVEGLKTAGRDLSRAKLLRALEKLYELDTGLTPPITYGANRRIGALGAYVVTVDLEKEDFVPIGGWIAPR